MNMNIDTPATTTAAATTPVSAVKELDNILFRFAVTDNGPAFNRFLDTYLVSVIEKVASDDQATKKKVMEVLGNINKRTMFSPDLVYPIDGLLALYHRQGTHPLVKNFAIVYIEKAFNALAKESRPDYLNAIVQNIHLLPLQHQDIFCHIVLSILTAITSFPKTDAERDKIYTFGGQERDCKVLLDFFLDVLMVPAPQMLRTPEGVVVVPPCHSGVSLQRVMGKNFDKYDFNALSERKMAILSLLTSGLFPDTNILPHCIVASSDTLQTVAKKAEETLKRLPKINWENEVLIDPTPPLDNQRRPAAPATREKLLHYFCRSLLAANKFPATLHIIFEGVYGDTTTMKLKQASMTFVQWVFRHAHDRHIVAMGPIIMAGLLKLLDSMEGDHTKEVNELKAFTYTSLGMLCKRNNKLFNQDLALVMKLMSMVGKEEPIVSSAIQDALIMLREAFVDVQDPAHKENLIRILMTFISSSEYQIRMVVLQWAQHCFAFEDVPSRYMSLVMSGDARPDIREEARRGLEPYVHSGNMLAAADEPALATYPDFEELLRYILKHRNELLTAKKMPQGVIQVLGYTAVTYENILILLRTAMRKSAISKKQTPATYLASVATKDSELLASYLALIESALFSRAGDDLFIIAAVSLLQLLDLYPAFLTRFVDRIDVIAGLLKSGKYATRELLAKVIGLIAPQLTNEQLPTILGGYVTALVPEQKDVLEAYGPILATGYIVARLAQLGKPIPVDVTPALATARLLAAHTNLSIRVAAITSIGLMGLYSPLPLPIKDRLAVVEELTKMLEASDRGVSEAVLSSLAWLSLGDSELSSTTNRASLIDALFKLVNNKNEELQFAVGDAISLVIGGHILRSFITPFSPFSADETRTNLAEERGLAGAPSAIDATPFVQENVQLAATLERIVSTFFSDRQSPVTRCSAGIWMLCLVRHFGGVVPQVHDHLALIQKGFVSLLADNNELTQDIAAKGITLVYDASPTPEFREFLVSNLANTLAGKPTAKAPASSEMLPAGSVTQGGQHSTFKELSALSSELGKPDMIYRFMQLSSHHQIWNSRRGASFAIVALASRAKEDLAPLLPSLIPKIYRYLYDPSPRIATSMRSIMTSLIDQKSLFPAYFAPIMRELLAGMGTSAWRVREASCAAIPDTIVHSSADDMMPFIQDLYYANFKTLDDMKESVRKAAEAAIKSLGSVTARLCDASASSTTRADEVLKVVIPLLLEKGLSNESTEVKQFTITQLTKISATAKDALAPYVADMVRVLLESLSSLESAAFNYASFHTESFNVSADQLERIRIEAAKSSPLSELLDQCLRYIGTSNINAVFSNLMQMIQFSVGIVTRVGVARFIANLLSARHIIVADVPEATLQRLVTLILPSLLDRSPATRRQFVSTLCIVIRRANSPRIMRSTISHLMSLVAPNAEPASGDDNVKIEVVGLFFKELYRIASSEIAPFNKDLIPFLYFFRSHPNKEVADLYKTIWEDNSIGSIKLYTDEIIKLIGTNLGSNSWALKTQAAMCLSDLTEDIRSMIEGHLAEVLGLVISGLKGKTYPGKDSLLGALSTLVTVCSARIKATMSEETLPSPTDLLMIMLGECKKSDLDYKRKALLNLSLMLSAFKDIDVFNQVKEVLYPLVFDQQQKKDGNNNNMEVDEDPKSKPLMLMIRTAAYTAIGEAYGSASKDTQRANIELGDKLLGHLIYSIWNEQVSILSATKLYIHAVWNGQPLDANVVQEEWVSSLFKKLFETLATKYNVVKKASLDLVEQIIADGRQYQSVSKQFDQLKIEIDQAYKKDSTSPSFEDDMEPIEVPKISKGKDDVLINAGAEEGSIHTFSEEEKVAYSKFISERLADQKSTLSIYIPIDSSTNQLFTACNDGVLLNKLMESMFPAQVEMKGLVIKAKMNPFERVGNQNIVIKNALKVGCIIVNIGAQDLVNATEYLVLGIIWQIIKAGLLSKVNQNANEILDILFDEKEEVQEEGKQESSAKEEHSAEQILMRWVNYHLEKSDCERRIKNFSEDVQDSIVYANLFAQLVPLEFSCLVEQAQNEPSLFARAEFVTSACDKIGVKCFLTPSDIALGHPKLNLALVASLFNSEAAIADMRQRMEIERADRERLEREKIERDREETERAERERLERERMDRERLENEAREREIADRERKERERIERDREETERAERERLERERLDREKAEFERAELERLEREREEQLLKERREQERLEREREERERVELEMAEKLRLENERIQRERQEKEIADREKAEREAIERERVEREIADRERVERERLEKELMEDHKEYRIAIRIQKKMAENPSVTENMVKLAGEITELKRNLIGELRSTRAQQLELGRLTKSIDRVLENKKEGKKLKKSSKKKIKPVKGVPHGLNPAKMRHYQHMFYHLQNRPHVMGKILYLLTPSQMSKTSQNLLLSLFPYELSPREEDLFLKALTVSLEYQLYASGSLTELLTTESVPMNMLFTYFKKKGLKYLQDIVTPTILKVLEKPDLCLNFDPIWIYRQIQSDKEIKEGKKAEKNVNLTFTQALEDPQVAALFDSRIRELLDFGSEFFMRIIRSIDSVPVQLRYLCRVITEKTVDGFTKAGPEDPQFHVTYYLFIYRFVTSIISSPDQLNELVLLSHPLISRQDRMNLGLIARLIQSVFTNKPWLHPFATPKIAAWIEEHKNVASKFLMSLADVPDLDELIHYKEYNDIMNENQIGFCTVIGLSEVIWLHETILELYHDLVDIGMVENHDVNAFNTLAKKYGATEKRRYATGRASETWWMQSSLDNLESPLMLPEQGDRAIQLTFINRSEHPDESMTNLAPSDPFKEAKLWMIEVLAKVPSPKKDINSIQILKDAITYCRSGNNNADNMGLISKCDMLIERLKTLRQDLVSSAPDTYDIFLLEVEKDLQTILRKNKVMRSELNRLHTLLKTVRIDSQPLEKLVAFQNEQLAKAIKKKELQLQQAKIESKEKPIKYTLSELVKKGMVLSCDLPEASHSKTTVTIKALGGGVFEIDAKIGPISKSVTLELDTLLDNSKNHIDEYPLEGITLHVNMTIHLLMKLFNLN
eukprot:gene192-230_t